MVSCALVHDLLIDSIKTYEGVDEIYDATERKVMAMELKLDENLKECQHEAGCGAFATINLKPIDQAQSSIETLAVKFTSSNSQRMSRFQPIGRSCPRRYPLIVAILPGRETWSRTFWKPVN